MSETETTSETTPSVQLTARQRSNANLRPFKPGQSGNPSGLAADGLCSKDSPLRQAIRAKAAKARELERFVNSWWSSACDGDSQAREQILKRLDPVTDDSSSGRQVVYEGLVIETPSGARAELVRGLVQALDQDVAGSRSEDVTLSTSAVVVHDTPESHAGATAERVDDSVLLEPQESPVHRSTENYLVDPATLGVDGDRSAQAPRVAGPDASLTESGPPVGDPGREA